MEPRTRQCEPNCCPFKDFKCPLTGETKKIVFIADIPIEERHKYLDPEQDINHPSMKIMGHPKNELENPIEAQCKIIEQQNKQCCELKENLIKQNNTIASQNEHITMLSNKLLQLTNQFNEITTKLKNMNA